MIIWLKACGTDPTNKKTPLTGITIQLALTSTDVYMWAPSISVYVRIQLAHRSPVPVKDICCTSTCCFKHQHCPGMKMRILMAPSVKHTSLNINRIASLTDSPPYHHHLKSLIITYKGMYLKGLQGSQWNQCPFSSSLEKNKPFHSLHYQKLIWFFMKQAHFWHFVTLRVVSFLTNQINVTNSSKQHTPPCPVVATPFRNAP